MIKRISTLAGFGFGRFFTGLFFIAAVFAPWGSAHGQEETDPVVATVNGADIHRSDLEQAASMLPAQYQQMPFEVVFPALLEQVVDAKLIEAAGRKENIQNDAEVIERFKKAQGRIIQQVYLVRYVEPRLTEEALRQHYDELVAVAKKKEEVHARHILVDTREEAEAIIVSLNEGADFIKLAAEKSVAPEAAKGGDLGFFTREEMVPEFSKAAFALGLDEISSEPVKTAFGWHVIKVEDRREAKAPAYEDIKGDLHSSLSQKLLGNLVSQLRQEAKITLFDIEGNPLREKEDAPKMDSDTDHPDSGADH